MGFAKNRPGDPERQSFSAAITKRLSVEMKHPIVIASVAKQSRTALAKGAAFAKGTPSFIAGLDCFARARNDGNKSRARFMRRGRHG
jgi:hypothetical protein